SESVLNKNENEHSPPATPMEELSQSDSRFDEDMHPETPHQMGRFFVEKINKQELANDVKSHTTDKSSNIGVKMNKPTATIATSLSPHISSDAFKNNNKTTVNNNNHRQNETMTSGDNNRVINGGNHHNAPLTSILKHTKNRQSLREMTIHVDTVGSSSATYDTQSHDTDHAPLASAKPLLSNSRPIAQWTIQDCVRWISSLGDAYVGYAVNFEKNATLHQYFCFLCLLLLLLLFYLFVCSYRRCNFSGFGRQNVARN
ncbi:hypothetical protein RFI_01927, partial [Reticulomyxa filosa]